jgi:hypothetical protein
LCLITANGVLTKKALSPIQRKCLILLVGLEGLEPSAN